MDLGGDFGLNSLRRLKSLCKMLRDDADKILTGEMSVTITTRTLCELNEAVDNLQDGLSPPHLSLDMKDGRPTGRQASDLEEWNFYLQLVLDIVSKAPVLVLYRGKEYRETTPAVQTESSVPVSQPVRLGYFTSLSHLEISYIPIQSIQDLLKMRERLETLVVTNCYSTNFRLQDVLEMCDQEVSVPMQWAALRHLCLRCDNLTELDGSLRLCPRLEMVDLSRNRLSTTEVYLGYLMELTYVDLSYNVLTVLPSFSATAKKKLRVLLLAGNKLVDLSGVEDMLSLEELDVSENLISSHRCLLPVRALYRLDKLNMKDCPASMRKDHRLLALQHISTVSLSRKFSLDNRLVTPKEIQNSRAALNHRQYITHRREPRRTADHTDGTSETIQNCGDQHPTTEDVTVNFSSARKKKGRKKAKARMTEIPDMDTSTGGEFSSRDVTPSGTPKTPSRMEALAQLRRLEVQEKRAELEHLRRYYGDSWLQAVEDQAVLPRPSSSSAVAHVTDSASEGAAETSQSSRKPAGKDNSVTVVVELHNGVAGKSELQSAASRNSAEGAFHKDAMFLSSESGAEDGGTSDVPAQASARLQPCGDDLHTDDNSQRTEETLLSGNSQLAVGKDHNKAEEKDERVKKKGEESPGLWDSLHDTMIEPEDQSDPFIVTLPDNPDGHLIITVSPRYLVEKDINGAIQDKLDLQCLQSARVEVEEVQSRPGEAEGMDDTVDISLKEVRVFLDFSYVRKDRRCRVYVMEDFITAQHFMELVQPFMDAKVEAAMKKEQVQYQCLKCSSQFSKAQAHTVIPEEGIPRTGSSKDFRSMADIGGEKVVLRCPKCSSYHVVLLEAGAEHSHTPLASSLPSDDAHRDSFVRKQSFDQLIASQSPKAHSTPLKQQDSGLDAQFTRSAAERRDSKPRAFRSLFGADDQDHRQVGDSPDPAPSVGPLESSLSKQSQECAQVWEGQEDGGTNQASLAPAAAPVVSTDSHAWDSEGYDFRHINHRMTLYLMMSVFDNDEEFRFTVKSCVCQYMMNEEYEALVIVTNMKLYILRINTEDVNVELSEALTLMEAQPHAELQRVDVGLGSQTLRLEYLSDCSSYTLVLRNSHKVHTFKDLLSEHLQTYAMETGIPMSVVVNDDVDQQTLDNLNADVLTRGGQADCLRLYILGYIARGHHLRQPMAFVVSSSQVCLVKTNHQWPSPHQQAPVTVDTVGKQFTVLERQKVNNIATVEKHEEDKCRLRITFFNESSGDETQWLVTMETEAGVTALVEAVRGPWEEAFGVEMDVEVSAFELSF